MIAQDAILEDVSPALVRRPSDIAPPAWNSENNFLIVPKWLGEPLRCLGDSFVLPVSLMVFHRSEGSALHAIDVNSAVQVIDLMLQNACIPTRCMNRPLVALLVETFERDFASTGGRRP
jgi:hypothetical protein